MTTNQQNIINTLAKYSWNGDRVTGLNPNTPLTITYSFLDGRPAYYSGEYGDSWLLNSRSVVDVNSFSSLSQAQKDVFNLATEAWAAVANITFVQSIGQIGDIAVTNIKMDPDEFGNTLSPNPKKAGVDGDIFLNSAVSQNSQLAPGQIGYETIFHELGHALGLDHPKDYKSNESSPYLTDYPDLAETANTKYTTMVNYIDKFGGWWLPSKPMLYDILAIQYLYGVNPNTNAGDNIFQFKTGALDAIQAIWDASGTDTIDASDQSQSVTIDLRPGHFSFVGSSEKTSKSQIAIAFQVAGQENNWIENAIGSSKNDHLTGNGGNNRLEGGRGKDTLEGGAGADTLIGGEGEDLYIIEGNDTIVDSGQNRIFYEGKLIDGVFTDNGSGTIFTSRDGKIIQFHSPGHLTLSAEDSITFQNQTSASAFAENDFGIHLQTAAADVSASVIPHGDLKPLDQDPNTDGIQIDYDALGNVKVGDEADPGRDDTLYDDTGNDLLQGMGGSDILLANRGGDNLLYADQQQDFQTLYNQGQTAVGTAQRGDLLASGGGNDQLYGSSGQDVLAGGDGADILLGGGDDDLLYGDGGIANASGAWSVTSIAELDEDGVTHHRQQLNGAVVQAVALGGNDILYGGNGNDLLLGGQGNDVLDGGAGRDLLQGGAGNDVLYADEQNAEAGLGPVPADRVGDFLSGGTGDDILIGGGRSDALMGGEGSDWLEGGAGNDIIFADADYTTSVNDWTFAKTDQTYPFADSTRPNLNGVGLSPVNGSLDTGQGGDDMVYGGDGGDWVMGGRGDDVIYGENGMDALDGGAGNDTVYGGANDDGLDGDLNASPDQHGDDYLDLGEGQVQQFARGGGGSDTILGGDTNDIIEGDDMRVGYAAYYHGNDFIDAKGGNDTVWGEGGADTIYGGDGDDNLEGDAAGIDAQYQGADLLFGGEGNDNLFGDGGNDTLDGGSGIDYLAGGAGDDTYQNVTGEDTIGDIDGHNTIQLASANTVTDLTVGHFGDQNQYFLLGIVTDTGETVKIQSAFFGTEATLAFANGDQVDLETLVGTSLTTALNLGLGNDGGKLYGGAGADTLYGGSGNDILIGGMGDDRLFGYAGDDTLDGGMGNDWLYDNGGNNTYRFGRGDGQDTIMPSFGTEGKHNTLQFKEGINAGDIVVARSAYSDDLVLSLANTNDKITIRNFFTDADVNNTYNPIQHIQFSDGTGLNFESIKAAVLAGNDTSQGLFGFVGADNIRAAGGDDSVYGNAGDDTLDGGTGNDYLSGGLGSDTYLFNLGYGQDRIEEVANGINVIKLGAGILPGSVILRRPTASESDYNDGFVLDLGNGSDKLILNHWRMTGGTSTAENYVIQRIEFADGTVWTVDDIKANLWHMTNGNDTIVGYPEDDDYFNGLGGNDSIVGSGGNDVLFGGDGNDTIQGGTYSGKWDQVHLEGGAGNDDLTVIGDGTAAVLVGGRGNDTIHGGNNSDVYFSRGDGNDLVYFSNGTLIFGAGISLVDLKFTRDANSLFIGVNGGDQITVSGQFVESYDGFDRLAQILFADGSILTAQDIQNRLTLASSEGNDIAYGTASDDREETGFGADQLFGFNGNDTLMGGGGNDNLDGGDGNDVIDGGAGNDTLRGGRGSDYYYFGRGSGQDYLYDSVYQRTVYGRDVAAGDTDTIRLSLLPNEIVLARGGYNNGSLMISIIGASDQLEVYGWFNQENIYGTLKLEFSDGTVWDGAAIEAHSGSQSATSGADYIYGSPNGDSLNGLGGGDRIYGNSGNDVLDGGGNTNSVDELYGGEGDDTYLFGYGSGTVQITEYELLGSAQSGSGNDTIQFTSGVRPQDVILEEYYSDLRIKLAGSTTDILILSNRLSDDFSRIERAVFADGTVWDLTKPTSGPVSGTSVGETLNGSKYDDVINGQAGNDTINGGSGFDSLYGGDGDDTLDGGSGNDLLLGGSGNDYLYGGEGKGRDVLDGGAGNDTLAGGDDIYVFGHGYGADVVTGYHPTGIVRFNADISPNLLRLSMLPVDAANYSTLRIALSDSSDTLDIQSFEPSQTDIISRFEFADGTIWNLNQILAALSLNASGGDDLLYGSMNNETIAGLNGADRIYGFAGNDVLSGSLGIDYVEGGDGNDTLDGGADGEITTNTIGGGVGDLLIGGAGDDTYLFGLGYGTDQIRTGNGPYSALDHENDGSDTIRMGAGIRPEDVVVTGQHWHVGMGDQNEYDLQLVVSTTGDKLVLDGWFIPGVNHVDRVEFVNGTVWDKAAIANRYWAGASQGGDIQGTGRNDSVVGFSGADTMQGFEGNDNFSGGAGDDVLYGGAGDDTLIGGSGNDLLNGGLGNDTYIFGIGSDKDLIVDFDRVSGGYDQIALEPGIAPEDVTLTYDDANILISINGTEDQLKVRWLPNPGYRIEALRFSNGVTWDAKTIEQKAGLDLNFAPELAVSLPDKNVVDGDTFAFALPEVFVDPDQGDELTYSARLQSGLPLPSWITFDAATKTFSGQPTGSNLGSTTIQVSVADKKGHVNSTNFNLSVTPAANMVLTGTELNDSLAGKSGYDLLSGLGGDDVLSGNYGEDTLEGGSGNDTLNGGTDGDVLLGGSGNDYLNGGLDSDLLVGGDGNDLYEIDDVDDEVIENSGEGVDTIRSKLIYTLVADNVENLILANSNGAVGDGNGLANTITGSMSADVLYGRGGNDTLDGSGGADYMEGGSGDDSFIVDNVGDQIVEFANEGIDTVTSSVSFTLGTEIENLVLAGADVINGTGNALDNVITGNSANNSLSGGSGNDTLDGGMGTDNLAGGTGNDVYIVDNIGDVVNESSGAGTDTVRSSVSYTLTTNVENLVLTGSDAIYATGNSLANILTGNNGNNILNGGTGADTMLGGLGDDIYVLDVSGDTVTELAGEGLDTVQSGITWTLGANVENLTLTGTTAINGTGNTLDNVLTGNSAANTLTGGAGNDTLDGRAGNDTLVGGAGNDIYVVDSTSDVVTENANEGTDTVRSTVSLTLANNVENLVLTGTSVINGTGNTLNNTLTGNSAANTLSGGTGADTMTGGAGDDIYVVDNAGDVVFESIGEGNDLVQSAMTYALSANVENLTLTGTTAINATGNALDNVLTGNSAVNTLTGGLGNDTYVVGTGDIIVENANEGIDTVQSGITWTLGANVENLTLTGTTAINGTGNTLDNVLTGNSAANTLTGGAGNDTLDGRAGNDTLVGGAGNDIYVVDSTSDVVTENANEGTDTVRSTVSLTLANNVENLVLTGTSVINGTGNTLNNTLTGNSAANTLSGGTGADTMAGGAGDDIYVVDNAGDVVSESIGEGNDLVQSAVTYALSANIENLTLTGTTAINATGNALDNVLTGNSAANVMTGGAGNDTYVVGSGDTVAENANEGIDTVQSGITWTLGANVENLTLTGTTTINGTGNTLDNVLTGNSAVNTLTGGAGNDTLDGGAGADSLVGGTGDDTYYVDNASDIVTENANEGTDTVRSGVAYTLGNNVENLVLTGTTAINGTGNTLNNVLTGNSAVNTLTGGAGNDTLDGGAGADSLVGGMGDDTYYVDNASDIVTENANEGTDTVNSSAAYTLGNNVENLVLTGTAAINGTGNTLNNTLTGNAAANTLSGGTGADTMMGGVGDDIYVVDNAGDVVIEAIGEGTDAVQSSLTWTLGANLESLTLTGTTAINGTGNALDNVLAGNSAANVLSGGAGNDTYVVGTGDTVVEYTNEGIDTVQSGIAWTLGANVENLTLTGTAAINGTGNSLDNVLTGNSVANTLTGGVGNDTYVVGSGDTVVENANEGIDTVQSSITWTLGANVENLTLTGTTAINGTGNEEDNFIIGNSAANVLIGGTGYDTLDGGLGADNLSGGVDDDYYYVDNVGDAVFENADEGWDTVETSISGYTLITNVENLQLAYGAGAINGSGNDGDNQLYGNQSANLLSGGLGDDTLDGGLGADTLMGGVGDDYYYVDNLGDIVVESMGEGDWDTVETGINNYSLAANVEGLNLAYGAGAINGIGNTGNNSLNGNESANILSGGFGNDGLSGGDGTDTLVGGDGNDTYWLTDTDINVDTLVENAGEGVDTVYFSEISSGKTYELASNIENAIVWGSSGFHLIGNNSDNQLLGDSSNSDNAFSGGAGNDYLSTGSGGDQLDGGEGMDTLVGGNGNDTYQLGRDYGADTVVENDATAGNTDVALFVSGVSADQLWFVHTGNNLEVSIIGTSDKLVVQDWYSGSANHVEQFKTTDGNLTLLDSQVESLVSAMAAFAPPASGQTTLPANYQTALAPVIAANWH
ncbi:calcium-binding protein (plasmid) [Methylomonas sp. MED-D]|uniref:calcium-binding protein n=1 Tax=Methylomonas sp. MED-D TaxID=3418768 RepID=UPI003D03E8C4